MGKKTKKNRFPTNKPKSPYTPKPGIPIENKRPEIQKNEIIPVKRPMSQLKIGILVAVVSVTLTALAFYIREKLTNGPDIKISTNRLYNRILLPDGSQDSSMLFILYGTIYNTGNKKYFQESAEFKVKIDDEWIKIDNAFYDSLDNENSDHTVKVQFIRMINLDTLKSIGGDDNVEGRFIFRTQNKAVVRMLPGSSYKGLLTLTDQNGKEYKVEGEMTAYDGPRLQDRYY